MTERCLCAICCQRAGRGEPPLPGVSLARDIHLTRDDFPPSQAERMAAALDQKRQAAWERRSAAPPVRPPAPITRDAVRREIEAHADRVMLPAVGEAIRTLLLEAEERVEARIVAIEAAMTYKGNWQQGAVYERRNIVSMAGAIFYCGADSTTSRPGVGGDWICMCPKARDGRDAPGAAPPPPRSDR